MLNKSLLLPITLLILTALITTSCGGSTTSQPTTTTPTTTKTTTTATSATTQTTTPTTTTTSSPYAIIDKAFEAIYKSDCVTDVPVTGKNDYVQLLLDVPYEDFTIYVGDDGRIVLWGYGVKHTWIGKSVYAGYTFDSDANDPLQFRVDREKGYVYVKGKGVVIEPDGKEVSLP